MAAPLSNRLPPAPFSVSEVTEDLHMLDITEKVQLDPQHPYPIGCGVGGEVYRGFYTWTDPNTLHVFTTKSAIKQLVSAGVERQRLDERVRREVANWHSLKHPNVTQFLGIAYVHPGRPACLVSPFIERNDFLAYIGRHPGSKTEMARQIAYGVQYLRSKNIVHGDLRVENVLVSELGVAQINDFGMSRILETKGFTTTILRNIRFNAPELMPITEDACEILPTYESDIFSLGILFLQLFNGYEEDLQKSLPYNHVRHRNGTAYDLGLLRRIHKGERPIRERYAPMSDNHWNLISMCWQGPPSSRPDIDWVVNALY